MRHKFGSYGFTALGRAVSPQSQTAAHNIRLRESECSVLEVAMIVKVIFSKFFLAALTERCVEWGPAAALR